MAKKHRVISRQAKFSCEIFMWGGCVDVTEP